MTLKEEEINLKEEIAEILHPEKSLHPPRAPIVGEKDLGDYSGVSRNSLIQTPGKREKTDSKPTIDFNSMPKDYWNWCDSLDTKRCWELARLGRTHRGSTAQLKRDVEKKKEELDMIKELKKIDPNAKNFGNVINEFKDKVERLRKRNE